MTAAVAASEQKLETCLAGVELNCGLTGHITIDGVQMPDYDIAEKLLSYWQVARFQAFQANPNGVFSVDPQDLSIYRPAFAVTALNELLLSGAQASGQLASDSEVRSKAQATNTDVSTSNGYTAEQDHLTIEDQKDKIASTAVSAGQPADAPGPQANPVAEENRTTAFRNWLSLTIPKHSITIDITQITPAELPADLSQGL